MKVGIFDSGMGGLSVLYHALEMMPDVDFLYYADEEHVPYGEKSEARIRGYIDEIIAFMLEKQVDAIVIACNTATSAATKEYRSKFPVPIIGMEPAVKRAVELYADIPGRILVAATPFTIAGDKLLHLVDRVDKADMVDLVALPKLVRLAERGQFEPDQVVPYLKEALAGYPLEEYKAFVLGCTHFNYFKESYHQIFTDKTKYVDGNLGTIRQLMRNLPGYEPGQVKVRTIEYYFSGRAVDEKERERIEGYLRQLDRVE